MNLVGVFLRQGWPGVICPPAFAALIVAGTVVGVRATKLRGYVLIAGAWVVAGAFVATVTSGMFKWANAPSEVWSTCAIPPLGGYLLAINVFLGSAACMSAIAIAVLAVTRFDKRQIAIEVLAVCAWILLALALNNYVQALDRLWRHPA